MRILYIEDDERVRKCTELMLKRLGHTVISRIDTEKVCTIADIWKPDLVIIDHDLGEGKEKGLQCALRLKDVKVNVVMMSGNHDALKGARDADIPFFMKPYVISNLLDEVKTMTEKTETKENKEDGTEGVP